MQQKSTIRLDCFFLLNEHKVRINRRLHNKSPEKKANRHSFLRGYVHFY